MEDRIVRSLTPLSLRQLQQLVIEFHRPVAQTKRQQIHNFIQTGGARYDKSKLTKKYESLLQQAIEKNREKIKIIQDKFVNFERGFINPEDDLVSQLTVIWGAKESLFKIYPHGGLTFKHDIDINSFKISDKKTTGYIKVKNWDKQYDIRFEQIEDFTLVYALDPS